MSWSSNWLRVIPFLCVSDRDQKNKLYNERDRVAEQVAEERDEGSNDEAVLKLLYLALRNIAKKWTLPVHDWKATLNRFSILYECHLAAN